MITLGEIFLLGVCYSYLLLVQSSVLMLFSSLSNKGISGEGVRALSEALKNNQIIQDLKWV